MIVACPGNEVRGESAPALLSLDDMERQYIQDVLRHTGGQVAGKGGGYMISSANSITDYCKLENVWAMSRAIGKYRTYR